MTNLMKVCSRWLHLIPQYGVFWSSTMISKWTKNSLAYCIQRLERSKNYPLNIRLWFRGDTAPQIRQSIWDLIRTQLTRCRSLKVENRGFLPPIFPLSGPFPRIVSLNLGLCIEKSHRDHRPVLISTTPFEALERLSLCVTTKHPHSRHPVDFNLNFSRTFPQLRSLAAVPCCAVLSPISLGG